MRPILAAVSALCLTGPARAEVDLCLVGTWQADTADMAHVFKSVMGAEAASASGDM